MKSHLILILGFLALIGVQPLAAQFVTSHLETPNCSCYYASKTIGRVYETAFTPYIISYHQHGERGEFLASDYTALTPPNNMKRMLLDPGTEIRDFEIFNNEVYFCGTYQGRGIIGHFNVIDLISGSPSISPRYAILQGSNIIMKLDVCQDPFSPNVIIGAVGITPSSTHLAPASSCMYTISIDPSWNVSYYYLQDTKISDFQYDYAFQDVAITNDYIVFSGVKDVLSNEFNIYMVDKSNLFTYVFGIFTEPSGQLSDLYEIETLNGNDVALATLNIYSDGTFYTRVHTYDVASQQIIHSQDIPLVGKAWIDDLQFLNSSTTLLVLLRDEFPNQGVACSSVRYVDPYPLANYTVNFHYDPKALYASLDHFPNTSYYIASGEMNTLNHTFMIQDRLSTDPTLCHYFSNVKADIIQMPSGFINNNSMPFFNASFISLGLTLSDDQIKTTCFTP